MPADKTIKVSAEVKRKLDSLKVHPRETYEDVIRRLIEFYERSGSGTTRTQPEDGGEKCGEEKDRGG